MRTLVLLASACLVGGTVEAQATVNGRPATAEEERRAATAVSALRDGVLKRFMYDDSASMNRATLGVTLGGAAHKRDTLGVFVEAVAENGPAERAGIYEGHRIAFINGIDVRATAADAGDAYLSSVGKHRLSKAMRDLTAGNTVTLRVWTGSGYRDVQVTTARFTDVYKNQRFGGMWEGPAMPGGMSFGPAMEHMKIEMPLMREFHPRPAREVRVEVRPGQPDKIIELTPTPRAPRAMAAPSVMPTPRVISVPRLAPTPIPTIRRRFVI